MSELLSAISLVAAVVAVYYAWRSADLGRLERRERALKGVVDAVDEVRRTADAVIASYDGRRDRAEQSAAALRFRGSQESLRLALAGAQIPTELAADQEFRERLAAMLNPRPLGVVNAASPVLDGARRLQASLGDPGRLTRALRRAGQRRHLFDLESGRRPSGGCAVQTSLDQERRVEMVLPAPRGGLVHLWRDASDPERRWVISHPFATGLGEVSAVSLCRADYGAPNSLEIIARVDGALHHLSRPTSFGLGTTSRRDAPAVRLPVDDARGIPAIVQGVFGNRGNFEVVTPRARGGLLHMWRHNDDEDAPWATAGEFGEGALFDAVALIHGDLHDHLEVVARAGTRLLHFWRTNAAISDWREAPLFDPAVKAIVLRAAGAPGFVQSRRRGSRGNFEVVLPVEGGGLMHLWRDNDDDRYVWRSRLLYRGHEMDAAAIFEGDLRPDGTRDLEILAYRGRRTVELVEPQPLPRGPALTRLTRPAPEASSSDGLLPAGVPEA